MQIKRKYNAKIMQQKNLAQAQWRRANEKNNDSGSG